MAKELIIEEWESYQTFRGTLWKLDMNAIAEAEMNPELLEMDEDQLNDWWAENKWEYDNNKELSVVNEGDGDYETTIYDDASFALSNISWRGFYKGECNDMAQDSKAKQDRIDALKKELEELQK